MGVYLYFSVLILSLFLILNIFTAQTDALQLSVSHDGDKCQEAANNSVCAVIAPYDRYLTLTCTSDSSGKTLEWLKEHPVQDKKPTGVEESSATKPSEEIKLSPVKANARIKISGSDKVVLNFTSVQIEDEGHYFCQESSKDATASTAEKSPLVEVRVLPYVKSGKDLNVIEENPLVLTCHVLSSQPVTVEWNVSTLEYNTSKLFRNSEGRAELKSINQTTNAEYYVKSANLTKDRGSYVCFASNAWGKSLTNATYFVRVKSKYAALWPFLGMCAEVIILCTIIFIYEKKRDKTELEESDTDQGPETKSSPDHGQDSVRYRK